MAIIYWKKESDSYESLLLISFQAILPAIISKQMFCVASFRHPAAAFKSLVDFHRGHPARFTYPCVVQPCSGCSKDHNKFTLTIWLQSVSVLTPLRTISHIFTKQGTKRQAHG